MLGMTVQTVTTTKMAGFVSHLIFRTEMNLFPLSRNKVWGHPLSPVWQQELFWKTDTEHTTMDNNSKCDTPSPAPIRTEMLTEICELVTQEFFFPHIKAFSLMTGWNSECEYPAPLPSILNWILSWFTANYPFTMLFPNLQLCGEKLDGLSWHRLRSS